MPSRDAGGARVLLAGWLCNPVIPRVGVVGNKGFKIVPLAAPREETSTKRGPVEHLGDVAALSQHRSGSAAAVVTWPWSSTEIT
jgi:hypothetical protein